MTRIKVEKDTLSLRMPITLLGSMDVYGLQRELTRTEVVEMAIIHLVNSKPCIFCGALIPPGGVVCPSCGKRALSRSEFDRKCDLLVQDYVAKYNLKVGNDHGYIHSYHIDIVPTKPNTRPNFIITYTVTTPDGIELRRSTGKSIGEKIPYETVDMIFGTPEEV